MSELQRWEYYNDGHGFLIRGTGSWVRADSALAIEQERDALKVAAVEDKRRIAEAAKVFDKIKWNICDSPESSIWSDVSKIEELLTEGAS